MTIHVERRVGIEMTDAADDDRRFVPKRYRCHTLSATNDTRSKDMSEVPTLKMIFELKEEGKGERRV